MSCENDFCCEAANLKNLAFVVDDPSFLKVKPAKETLEKINNIVKRCNIHIEEENLHKKVLKINDK